MYINWKRREIIITLALYGPQGSGKSATWRFWAKKADRSPSEEEDTFSLRTRTIQGKQVVLHIRDTSGHVDQAVQRRVSLYGVDGLVFVADSSPAQQEANQQSQAELLANLAGIKRSIHTTPFLLQYNKRDLPDAVSLETLQNALNAEDRWPYVETNAQTEEGLVEVLRQMTGLVLRSVIQEWDDKSVFYMH